MNTFFYSKPKGTYNKMYTVGDALEQLQAFKAVQEAGLRGNPSSNNSCEDENAKAAWRNQVYNSVINCGGKPTELNFFQKAFMNVEEKSLEATDLYIKYRCARDYNVAAQNSVQGAAPAADTSFTVLRSQHVKGKYSLPSVGGSLYIHEDNQWVVVINKDTTNDYAHVITVRPQSKDYTVNIRAGRPMLFNSVRRVNGYSCAVPSTIHESPGYIDKIQPARFRVDWETPLELDKPYEDILQFALMFDNEGNEIDSWELYAKQRAREEFIFRKNLEWFIGQRYDNPALLADVTAEKYAGFDGYVNKVRYGGGMIKDIDPSIGFDYDIDFQQIMTYNDSLKKSTEFMGLAGYSFLVAQERRNRDLFKNASGSCTFESFERMGADRDQIRKWGIMSYTFMNQSFHWKQMDALSDKRALGNGDFPNLGMLMPTMGNRDSKGREVPPIEFFAPTRGGSSAYDERQVDHRDAPQSCEKISGYIIDSTMSATHCPQNHILLNPVKACA